MSHSPFGYSAVSTFDQCPFQYRCRYVQGLKTLPTTDPANALVIGTALHRGIETDVDTAIREYYDSFPIITDLHIDEAIKLRFLIPKVKEVIPEGIHEVRVVDGNFMGTLDLLVPVGKGLKLDGLFTGEDLEEFEAFDLYDFKYINPNNQGRYIESRQLHLYKYYWEKTHPGKKIRNMYFVFVPKVQIRQKKTETIFTFRQRLMEELEQVQITTTCVPYDPQKVIDHLESTQRIMTCTNYPKNPTRLCDWCDYKNYCEKGDLIDMALPSIDRVPLDSTQHKKIWIYGMPFSGKTFLCDAAPTPLNLNTDGNVKAVTMARLRIKDTMDGRQKKLAWEVFKGAIDDLEAGSGFETIVVDLLEDTYESCRLWMYKQMGISHESDDSFRAWDKVRTEFLSTIRRLMNLPYNIILISHEDTSKDLTRRGGDKITAIKPNIQDKIANKVAGMVDIVIRAIKVDDEYILSTKTSDVIFGGGRLTGLKAVDVPNSWESIEAMYAVVGDHKPVEQPEPNTHEEAPAQPEQPTERAVEPTEPPAEEQPKRRTRRTRA